MSEKAKFEVREVCIPTNHVDGENSKKYMGQERRRENRRSGHDRRGDVLFEIGKDDRRQESGRREDDAAPTFW